MMILESYCYVQKWIVTDRMLKIVREFVFELDCFSLFTVYSFIAFPVFDSIRASALDHIMSQ